MPAAEKDLFAELVNAANDVHEAAKACSAFTGALFELMRLILP